MATYYIDPTAPAGGNGLAPDTAFDSWSDVTWVAGNTYLQKAGTIHNSAVTVGVTGSAGNVITIGSYGDGNRPKITSATANGLTISGRNYIRVENLEISDVGATKAGIFVQGLNIELYNCVTNRNTQHGIYIGGNIQTTIIITNHESKENSYSGLLHLSGSNAITTSTLLILDSDFSDNGKAGGLGNTSGISTYVAAGTTDFWSSIQIRNTIASNNDRCGISIVNGHIAWPTMVTSFNKNIVIENCECNNNGQGGIIVSGSENSRITNCGAAFNGVRGTLGGIWTGTNVNLIIEGNITHDNISNGIDGAGIFDDQNNDGTIVRRNYCFNNLNVDSVAPTYGGYGIAIYKAKNSKHYNNVCYNNHNNMFVGLTSENIEITNNTLVDATGNGFWIWFDQVNSNEVTLKNNVIVGNVKADSSGVGTQVNDYNVVTGEYSLMTPGAHSISTSPLLSTNYRPLPDSPCLDGGADLGYMRDREGKQCKKHIGAYGYARVI